MDHSADEQLTRATEHLHAGDLDSAERLLRQLIEIHPEEREVVYTLGLVCLRANRTDEAARWLERTVRLAPGYANAHAASLGVVLAACGEDQRAVTTLQEAIRLEPQSPEAHFNLAKLLKQQGDLSGAVDSFRQATVLRPRWPEAFFNLANTLQLVKRFDEAAKAYRTAIQLRPRYARAYNNLGNLLRRLQKPIEAERAYRDALASDPTHASARRNLEALVGDRIPGASNAPGSDDGVSLNDVRSLISTGREERRRGRLDAAIEIFRKAVEVAPQSSIAARHLGTTLRRQGAFEEAADMLRQAHSLGDRSAELVVHFSECLCKTKCFDEAATMLESALTEYPESAELHNVLGVARYGQDQVELAIAAYEKAIELKPDFHDALNNLGAALQAIGHDDQALRQFNTALSLRPGFPTAHLNRALIWLRRKDFACGWPEFEWRRRTKRQRKREFHCPRWAGGPITGKSILLHAEQGLGDTIQFLRYAALLKQRGARVVSLCQRPLRKLFQLTPLIDQVVDEEHPSVETDYHIPLMSLPGVFETDEANVPRDVPYLAADPKLVAQWSERIDEWPGFRVGIAWQGNPEYGGDRERSVPLRFFEPLAHLDGVRLISLQRGHGTDQLAGVRGRFEVIDLADQLDCDNGPFMDTAALMQTLDLVVTSDTAIPHLAGALAAPVWAALPFVPDWRWGVTVDDCMWYPTMRLFRQPTLSDWATVFGRIANALKALLNGGGSRPTLDGSRRPNQTDEGRM